jgi:TATA-box binding protein (TBP) (component of TFIID and TFIIIB)
VFSYEPEIHPGATVRLTNKAVLKVFTTGSVTLTGNVKTSSGNMLGYSRFLCLNSL